MTPDRPPPRHTSGTASAGIDDSSLAWLLRTWEDLAEAFVRLRTRTCWLTVLLQQFWPPCSWRRWKAGYLLSVIARHIAPLEVAIEMALQQVARSLADESLRAHD
jgi:hypothetical protein